MEAYKENYNYIVVMSLWYTDFKLKHQFISFCELILTLMIMIYKCIYNFYIMSSIKTNRESVISL